MNYSWRYLKVERDKVQTVEDLAAAYAEVLDRAKLSAAWEPTLYDVKFLRALRISAE